MVRTSRWEASSPKPPAVLEISSGISLVTPVNQHSKPVFQAVEIIGQLLHMDGKPADINMDEIRPQRARRVATARLAEALPSWIPLI